MATIFTDDFNAYSAGDLNGQGSWAGSVQFDVQATVVKEGAKAVIGNAGGDYIISKSGTARTDGKKTFYFRTSNHAGFGSGQYFQIRLDCSTEASAFLAINCHQDGYIKRWVDTGLVDIQTYVDDHWYCIEIEWRSSPDYKYRVRVDGGAWTDWGYGYLQNTWDAGLNRVKLNAWLAAGSAYIDYIAEEPLGTTHQGAATMSGEGTLAAKARRIRTAKATASGTGTLVAKARRIRSAKATASGAGALTAAAQVTNVHKLIGQDDQTISASVAANYHWTDKFTAVATGIMDRFRIKCSGSGNVKVAVYADSAGSPGALLNAVNTGQAVVAGWNEIVFPATQITQGTSYWLSLISDAMIAGYWNQAGNTRKYKSVAYAGFTFPDPAGSFDGQFTDVPDLTAGWQLAVYAAATLSGTGSLAVVGRATRIGKATLSGEGTLTAAGRIIRSATATLAGEGTLAAAGLATRRGAATMSGTGTLAAKGAYLHIATATLSGAGTLAAAGQVIRTGSATLSGEGTLAAAARRIRAGKATLSGEGTLAAAGIVITAALTGSATLSGTGTLAAAGNVTRTAQATMSGEGSLGAAAHVTRTGTATMSGTGSLAAKGAYLRIATATMSGTGSLSAKAVYIVIAKATMSGTGTLSAAATIVAGIVYASATLSGTGTLIVSATVYTITPTLLAAQKSPRRQPYVEAKVYDYEQGIKRLTWTRLYEGEETDNHHGIAFDGQGSMHRVRADTGSKLYYQKITNPGPSSDYTQWTEIATDCAGPCAIAAYGSKVYIFYRTSTNVLWKRHSHDYGQYWTNAQLIATADVLSMAACWQGATNTVVCFAATAIKVYAITLDTMNQATTEYYYNHGLDTTYGIGATYQAGEFPIVLAGKDTDVATSIVSYALYATKLSDIYAFSSLRVLLSADEDVVTAFRYPDCHLPAEALGEGGQVYETIQLTVVEDYSGVTAYTRPLLAHLVKDTSWSDATITEPRFFIPTSSAYGLRLQSTAGYWWFSTPDGVWRAPRPASPAIVLTSAGDIISLHQVIGHQKAGSLVLQLDNSKGYFASPGEGELASLRFRAEIQLRLGYKTTEGNEALDNLTYWIDSWHYSSADNRSLLTVNCLDLWGLASQWAARYSLRWNYTTFQPCRVWEILYQFLGRLGIRLWNNPDSPKSSTIDDYYPMFLSRGGTIADTQLRRLLSFVTDGLVPTRAICYAKDLLPAEASCYSYVAPAIASASAGHPIYAGAYGDKLTTTHTQVSGDTQDEPPVHVREAAFDWDLLSLGIDNLRMQYDANLEETDQAARRADALLRDSSLRAERGNLVIPTNVAQALYDVITVTDRRCGIDEEKYRVLAIQTDYDRHKSLYEQRLTLGAP